MEIEIVVTRVGKLLELKKRIAEDLQKQLALTHLSIAELEEIVEDGKPSRGRVNRKARLLRKVFELLEKKSPWGAREVCRRLEHPEVGG